MQCRQGRGSIPRVGIIFAGHEEVWEVVVLVVEIFLVPSCRASDGISGTGLALGGRTRFMTTLLIGGEGLRCGIVEFMIVTLRLAMFLHGW
jgi:hypothetical protein